MKLAIFDLDGVLFDSGLLHFDALNQAIKSFSSNFCITEEEHHSTYDGLSTIQKLNKLHLEKNLPKSAFKGISEMKQDLTSIFIEKYLKRDNDLIEIFEYLNKNKIVTSIASNSKKKTVENIAKKLGILSLVDFYLGGEQVKHQKPNPEIYYKIIKNYNAKHSDTFIFDDNIKNFEKLKNDEINLILIKNRNELTLNLIKRMIFKDAR